MHSSLVIAPVATQVGLLPAVIEKMPVMLQTATLKKRMIVWSGVADSAQPDLVSAPPCLPRLRGTGGRGKVIHKVAMRQMITQTMLPTTVATEDGPNADDRETAHGLDDAVKCYTTHEVRVHHHMVEGVDGEGKHVSVIPRI